MHKYIVSGQSIDTPFIFLLHIFILLFERNVHFEMSILLFSYDLCHKFTDLFPIRNVVL